MFAVDEEPTVKDYLTAQLEGICDADPDILAQFIMELLKHNRPASELKELCVAELGEFLKEHTQTFVNRLFATLSSKSFMESTNTGSHGNNVPQTQDTRTKTQEASNYISQDSNRNGYTGYDNHPAARGSNDMAAPRGTKRFSDSNQNEYGNNNKFQRRSSRDTFGGRDGRDTHGSRDNYSAREFRESREGGYNREYPNRDRDYQNRNDMRSNPNANVNGGYGRREYQNSGYSRGGYQGNQGGMRRNEYDDRRRGDDGPISFRPRQGGFNDRGDRGQGGGYNDRSLQASGQGMGGMNRGGPMQQPNQMPMMGMMGPRGGIPNRPPMQDMSMMNPSVPGGPANPMMNMMMPMGMQMGMMNPMQMGMMNPMMGMIPRRPMMRPGMGGNVGVGTKLVVDHIPEESRTPDAVRAFFGKFGTIVNVTMNGNKALIEFGSNQEAQTAYRSPEPIFGNRFVKVFWFRDDSQFSVPQQSNTTGGTSESPTTMTPEQMKAKADETAEKQRLAAELKQKMDTITKQKEEFIQKSIQEQKKIMAFLESNPDLSPTDREEWIQKLKSLSETLAPIIKSVRPETKGGQQVYKRLNTYKELHKKEMLDKELEEISKKRAGVGAGAEGDAENGANDPELLKQLDALKSAAAQQGIDPNDPTSFRQPYTTRGGYARGGYARGTYRPPFRPHQPYTAYNLDLRPRKLLVKFPTEATAHLEGHLRQYGEIESVAWNNEDVDGHRTAVVEYKTRKSAEMAMARGKDLETYGEILMEWYHDTSSSQPTSTPANTTNTTSGDMEISGSGNMDGSEGTQQRLNYDESESDDEQNERHWKR